MTLAANLGYPRIGRQRELKQALEQYWAGAIDAVTLKESARSLRRHHWELQREAGLAAIPSNDFSLYDHMLDMTALVGAVPERFGPVEGRVSLDTYFAMARGDGRAPAMEMTKWFDTNYHYIVPELAVDQPFRLAGDKPLRAFVEAGALGIHTRPVLVGPVTYLVLSKLKGSTGHPIDLLPRLLPVYAEILTQLRDAGADWVQLDEPALVLDLDDRVRRGFAVAYERLGRDVADLKLMVATYFGALGDNLPTAMALPVAGLHVDLARAPEQLGPLVAGMPADRVLSLGLVDGRNVWRADPDRLLPMIETSRAALGAERLQIAPSCSLLHCPIDLDAESRLDPEVRPWLAFARQKLREVALFAQAADGSPDEAALDDLRLAAAARRTSPRRNDPAVRRRVAAATPAMAQRTPYATRVAAQAHRLHLPLFPTTTIGSFPQTAEVRRWRAAHKRREIDGPGYERLIRGEIEQAVRWQEETGLDVLVHGEFERNDMVEYFGELLGGYALTSSGWVQSYGSRCVKPPILYGDVSRPRPMTVDWTRYAQSLTRRPVKGMLTGPVTLLQWSFVRDDQPREATARQVALAIRDEVQDLEAAGIAVIQVDEPALREGLPLRRAGWPAYLAWAGEAFRLTTSGVADATQIHTHMCYSEFNDIIEAIADLDADVISIETSRSRMELLGAFATFRYPNQVGPGVYDIHSPRVPDEAEMERLLGKALEVLRPEQLWVNPDCGLKTRRWGEVRPALERMVAAAHALRRLHEDGGRAARGARG